MAKLANDEFWDKPSTGVRSSIDGENHNKYHDPSTQQFEGNSGRSVGGLLPGGLRGVVVPRATLFGGSSGFDAHKPRLMNVDPDIKGQSCVVDLALLTREKVEAAYNKAANSALGRNDLRMRAAQTYQSLAVAKEPVGMEPMIKSGKATRVMSPAVAPRNADVPTEELLPVDEVVQPVVQTAVQEPMRARGFVDQTTVAAPQVKVPRPTKPLMQPIATSAPTPETKVTFELEGWGSFDAVYHEVIKNDCVLVLVYDNSFKSGMKFFPPATDKRMAVHITGQDVVYFVHSYNIRFVHGGCEYCILVVEQDAEVPNVTGDM